ncbi:MAG: stage 0 sporulation family protein [Desulfobacterales bacterium]
MAKVVGIRFKPAGKVYDFDAGAFVLAPGDAVIVETEQGLSLATVASAPRWVEDWPADKPLKKVYRLATPRDFEQREKNAAEERSAFQLCRRFIRELSLPMNLFAVEKAFDGSKITFFFTSEGRVDFRQLLKMLVRELGTRIEMRQVGIRNQTKMCGGIGRCGRELCCATHLEKFDPVSIRMAKEQGLSLNPTKISGQCGRLMCCLVYEYETYKELKKDLPRVGSWVDTPKGPGKIVRHNPIGGRIAVKMENGVEVEVPAESARPRQPPERKG